MLVSLTVLSSSPSWADEREYRACGQLFGGSRPIKRREKNATNDNSIWRVDRGRQQEMHTVKRCQIPLKIIYNSSYVIVWVGFIIELLTHYCGD